MSLDTIQEMVRDHFCVQTSITKLFLAGVTVIRSNKELLPDEWVVISASKSLNEGKLYINGDVPVVEKSKGSHKALNLQTPLYVGGYDKTRIKVNKGTGVNNGFTGCISEVAACGNFKQIFVHVFSFRLPSLVWI